MTDLATFPTDKPPSYHSEYTRDGKPSPHFDAAVKAWSKKKGGINPFTRKSDTLAKMAAFWAEQAALRERAGPAVHREIPAFLHGLKGKRVKQLRKDAPCILAARAALAAKPARQAKPLAKPAKRGAAAPIAPIDGRIVPLAMFLAERDTFTRARLARTFAGDLDGATVDNPLALATWLCVRLPSLPIAA